MVHKRFSYLPDASDTLSLLISTHLVACQYVITQVRQVAVSPLLTGILTCHYPQDQPGKHMEILWVLDVEQQCIRGYQDRGDGYPGGWMESTWAQELLRDYNPYIQVAFVDFFAVLREQTAQGE